MTTLLSYVRFMFFEVNKRVKWWDLTSTKSASEGRARLARRRITERVLGLIILTVLSPVRLLVWPGLQSVSAVSRDGSLSPATSQPADGVTASASQGNIIDLTQSQCRVAERGEVG